MKIALAHAHVFRYARGVERYTVSLASALARQGIETTIVTLQQPGQVPPLRYVDLDPAVRVHTLPNPRYFTAQTTAPLYLAHFWRARYDHILLAFADNGEGAAARAMAALPNGRTRYSAVFHFPYEASPDRFRAFERMGLLRHASQTISVSRYIAESVRQHLGVESSIIAEGVDPQLFSPRPDLGLAARARLGIAPTERVVLSVGALEERKGMGRLLEAIAREPARAVVDRLLIVGDGPLGDSLRAQAAHLGIAERVIWQARSTDLPALYNAADVFALLSDHEAFGLVALEAMACGCPVVVSDGSAFPEFVPATAGLLVDPTAPDSVAAHLAALLSDPQRARAMGRDARAHVEGRYTWDVVARRMIGCIAPSHLTTGTPHPVSADMPQPRPTLSVLIATYNRAVLLDRTLHSLLAPTVTDRPDEIVVVNGGTDSTEAVVAAHSARGAPIRLVPVVNRGLSHSQNVGFPHCTGDIVATLDDDVMVDSDWTARLRAAHLAYPAAGGIGGRIRNEFPDALPARFEQAHSFDVADDMTVRRVRTVAGVAMSYRRRVMVEVGQFDEALPSGMDVDYNWRVIRAGYPVLYDPSIVLTHHNRTALRGVLRQQFWYGRGFFRTRHKWHDLPARTPRGLWGVTNWIKMVLFMTDLIYLPLRFVRRAPTPSDRLPFALLALCSDVVFKAGYLREAYTVWRGPQRIE